MKTWISDPEWASNEEDRIIITEEEIVTDGSSWWKLNVGDKVIIDLTESNPEMYGDNCEDYRKEGTVIGFDNGDTRIMYLEVAPRLIVDITAMINGYVLI